MAAIQPRPTHILYQCAKCGNDRTSFNVICDNQSINVYLPNTNISDNINVDNIKYGAPWEQCQKKEIIK